MRITILSFLIELPLVMRCCFWYTHREAWCTNSDSGPPTLFSLVPESGTEFPRRAKIPLLGKFPVNLSVSGINRGSNDVSTLLKIAQINIEHHHQTQHHCSTSVTKSPKSNVNNVKKHQLFTDNSYAFCKSY